MDVDDDPPLRPLDVRRAVLGVLLRAGRPLCVIEVVAGLQREILGISGKRVADVLRFQVAAGRVRRVARGVYELDPTTMSPSTRWRSLNWQRVREQWWAELERGGRGPG
jgi:hypothetical protein